MVVQWVEILGEEPQEKRLPLLYVWHLLKINPKVLHSFRNTSILGCNYLYCISQIQLIMWQNFCCIIGFLQLAGGTNAHTVDGLKRVRLFQTTTVSGITLDHQWWTSCFLLALLYIKIIIYLSPEFSENERRPSLLSSSDNALISGIAFGGYARKVSS